ncbi:lipopolysaccharide biosynthesis protein RfbH [Novipirellula sp. SH528]|uniref:lipopolysaccharide biosynthesis protein RfbH n=1 Tax=Novipirellula sp. SH528 TaxID=3454466 RepID=UPI003FA14977
MLLDSARYYQKLRRRIIDDGWKMEELKQEILRLVREYSSKTHAAQRPGNDPLRDKFVPGESVIPYAGRVFDEDEVEAAVSSTLDFWLTLGKEGEQFEKGLAEFLGVRRSLAVNSGSSANLVALAALTSHKLPRDKQIRPGDEVITVAAGFPTTVAPIIQCGATAVFIDADPVTGNAKCEQLEDAYVPGKTKAVMMAHALGNPFDLNTTLQFCRDHDLWLIEDNCDALGCSYTIPAESDHQEFYRKATRNADGSLTKHTGSWGDLSTQSFYPPHHLTMGEGGAVNIVAQASLKVLAESFRDWGRDCWCASGQDNTCNKRFAWQLGELPEGYDHKYIYSHLGYNLKPLDIQAAIGHRQLLKLPAFVEARKDNWQTLRKGLAEFEDVIEFSLPTHATGWNRDGSFSWDATGCKTDCSWFGFKMSVRENAKFTRTDLARHLDEHKIGNRMLFGGNLLRQPALVDLKKNRPEMMRVVGDMSGADEIMNQTLFIGVYPGLSSDMLDYMIDCISSFAKQA